jgi:hypothetical protein
MIGGIFLPRFAFTFFGRELALPLIIIVAAIVALAVTGKLLVHVPRLILFALSMAAMMTAIVLGGAGRLSVMSFLLLAVLYVGYVFIVDGDEATYGYVVVAFRRMCLIAALAGIAQFFGQFLVPGPTLFTFRGLIPDADLALEYNYVDPVGYLSGLYKSNGFFLPEPSIFGQLMALAGIAEVLFFRPSYRLLVIAVALFLSFSGTGVVLGLVFIPLLLLRRGNPWLLIVAVCLCLLLLILLATDSRFLEPFIGRIGEFGSTQSSGFARFLSPFYLFDDFIFTSSRNTLFGLGPGAIDTFFNNFYTEVHDPTWGKLFFEYGIAGTLPFAIFVTCGFFADAPSKWLSGALFFNWLLLGGYLLSAPLTGLILPLAIWHRAAPKRQADTRPAQRISVANEFAGGSE